MTPEDTALLKATADIQEWLREGGNGDVADLLAKQSALVDRLLQQQERMQESAGEMASKAVAEISSLREQQEALKDSIEAFNRTDHDREGAALVWHDLYLEERRAKLAAIQQQEYEDRDDLVRTVKAQADVIRQLREQQEAQEQKSEDLAIAILALWGSPCPAAFALVEALASQTISTTVAELRGMKLPTQWQQQEAQERELEILRDDVRCGDESYRAVVGMLEAAEARIAVLEGVIRNALAWRARQLDATCPDCEPGCTHGIPSDPLTKMLAVAVLEGEHTRP